jgi:hypothetical protein
VVLVGHDHQVAVAQALGVRVHRAEPAGPAHKEGASVST